MVVRSIARDDRRKVMVCITPKGSELVRRIRQEMVGNLMKIMEYLSPDEQTAWLHIYGKIYDYYQSKDCRTFGGSDIKRRYTRVRSIQAPALAPLTSRRLTPCQ